MVNALCFDVVLYVWFFIFSCSSFYTVVICISVSFIQFQDVAMCINKCKSPYWRRKNVFDKQFISYIQVKCTLLLFDTIIYVYIFRQIRVNYSMCICLCNKHDMNHFALSMHTIVTVTYWRLVSRYHSLKHYINDTVLYNSTFKWNHQCYGVFHKKVLNS